MVPIVVPLKNTFTKGRGLPVVSFIVPDTEVCAARGIKKSVKRLNSRRFLILNDLKIVRKYRLFHKKQLPLVGANLILSCKKTEEINSSLASPQIVFSY